MMFGWSRGGGGPSIGALGAIERVINGAFFTSITGWTDVSTGTGAVTWTATDTGMMSLTRVDGSNIGQVVQEVTLRPGKPHLLIAANSPTSPAGLNFRIGTTSGGTQVVGVTSVALGKITKLEFTPTQASNFLFINPGGNSGSPFYCPLVSIVELLGETFF